MIYLETSAGARTKRENCTSHLGLVPVLKTTFACQIIVLLTFRPNR